MAKWVIRRKADGLYWSGGGWRDLERAFVWSQQDRYEDVSRLMSHRRCQDGEEWVELDDAGKPVEAKP